MSTKCTDTKANGQPCNAWAIRGSHPPRCAAHAGRTKGAGAPVGNSNALKHGFYSSTLTPDETAVLLYHATTDKIDDEIALARVMLRRLMTHLNASPPQLTAAQLDELPAQALIHLDQAQKLTAVAPLIFRGIRVVDRLLRSRPPGRNMQDYLDDILDDLAADLNANL